MADQKVTQLTATTSPVAADILEIVTDVAGTPTNKKVTYGTLVPAPTLAVDINRYGFLNQTETTLGFNDTTYVFTLGDAGAGWSYYRTGVKYTISGNKTVTLPGTPPTAGTYYIYIDATDGTLTQSTTQWTLNDTKVPVATVKWNNTLTPKYHIAEERHSCLIDRREHRYLHSTRGTATVQSATLSGYTLDSDVNANKTFAISQAQIADEDIFLTLAALTQPNGTNTDYTVFYRTAASTYAWKKSNMPFAYNVGNSNDWIQYDNGGTMTDLTGGGGGAQRWTNTYLLYTDITDAAAGRFVIVPGRAVFTSLAAAQAEDPTQFSWTGFPIDESVIAYQLTWRTNNFTSQGKCVLDVDPKRVSATVSTTVGVAPTTDHNSLANLQGGTAGEYYHLTSAQQADVATKGGAETLTNKTIGDKLQLAESGEIGLDPAGSADEKWSGITCAGTAGATVAVGDLLYLDVTATEWLLADADAASTSGDVPLGLCLLAANDGGATVLLLIGTMRSAAFPASIALGAPVYVSTTAGDIQAAQPSGTDDVIRRVGWAITAEPNTIYFNPSNDYTTHT